MRYLVISVLVTAGLIGTALGFSKKPPHVIPPVAKIQKTRPSLRCDIYVSSDGRYYTEIEGFGMSRWSEDAPEEALESAKGSLKRYYEGKARTFKLIGSQTITGDE